MNTRAVRTRWWVEALVVVWLLWIYDAVNNLAPLRVHAALSHGWALLRLERSLGLDPELALNRWLAAHRTLGLLLSDYYDNAHFIVTFALLGWLWYWRADIFRPLRNTLVAINLLGLLVFWLYPTAPPRLLPGSGFSDVVASTGALGGWHTGALASAANRFAAMPSLHLAWAVWSSLALWALSKKTWVRVLAVLHPLVTAFAVLATGNHYLLDVFAGVATAALAVLLVRAPEMRRRSADGRAVAPVGCPLEMPSPDPSQARV
jgi:PAP2 superfamily